MEIQHGSFYVTLLSNACLDVYPDNTLSKFKMRMPQVLNLPASEKWEVGIVNMSHSSIAIKSDEDPIQKIKPPITIKFSDGHQFFENQRDLTEMFQSNEKLVQYLKNIDYSKYNNKNTILSTSSYSTIVKKSRMNIKAVRKFNVKYDFEYSPEDLIEEIFSQLKFDDRTQIIDFFQNKAVFLPFPLIRGYFKVTENEPSPKNLAKAPDYLCCYCDIIYNQIVGYQLSRLLLMAPITQYVKQPLLEMNNIQYCAVERTSISEIYFLITDRYSNQIAFEDSDFMTRVLLHFRKRDI